MNEKAAKVLVEEIDPFQPKGKGPEAGGDARGKANQLTARTHAAPQQSYVRGKFRRAIAGTQLLEHPRQTSAHVACRHEPQGVAFPGRRLAHWLGRKG
jgi:hypothetical protein